MSESPVKPEKPLRTIAEAGWVFIGIGLPFFLAFTVFFLVGLYKMATYTHTNAGVTEWLTYFRESDGSLTLVKDDPPELMGTSRYRYSYKPRMAFRKADGDTVRFIQGGGSYTTGPRSGFKGETVLYTMGPPFEYFEYSVIGCWFAPLFAMLITGSVVGLGIGLLINRRRKKNPSAKHVPYHPGE
jgi:ABC-type sugar transport system permease subunit